MRSKIILAILALLFAAFEQNSAQSDPKADLVVQTGHTDLVGPVAFSPDGKYIVSGSWDGTVKLWETESGRELRSWGGFAGVSANAATVDTRVISVAFSPDGRKIVAGSTDGSFVSIQITSNGFERLSKCIGSISSVAFSPDGRLVAAACNAFEGKVEGTVTRYESSYKILRWELANARELPPMFGHELTINTITFSPDGKTLASGSSDKSIRLWDMLTGRQRSKISVANTEGIFSVAFSPNGKTLAAAGQGPAGYENAVRLWDVASGEASQTLEGVEGFAHSVTFSTDGERLAVCWDNSKFGFWNVGTGLRIVSQQPLPGHYVNSAVYSKDGRFIALSRGHDDTIDLLDSISGKVIRSFVKRASDAYVLALSPTSDLLATETDENSISLWSLGPGKMLRTLTGHTGRVTDMVFSRDGKFLASCSRDRTIKLWNVASGTEILSIAAHRYGVSAIAVSPDGQLLASVSSTTVKVWSIGTGKELHSIEMALIKFQDPMVAPMLFEPRTLAFSKDSKHLAAADSSRYTTRVFELSGGNEIATLNGNEPNGGIADFEPEISRDMIRADSKDGKFNFAVAENGKIVVSDARSKSILGRLVALGSDDWAFVAPDGLFDSSPGGRSALHFVLDLESISLDQMKEAYYTPGLFQAIFKEKPLPKVRLFTKRDLFPDVEFSVKTTSRETLSIRLRNRGGGIGQVQVLINGKEFVSDARPAKFDPDIKETELSVSLKGAPLISKAENRIEVIARNAAGTLSNRGTARGADNFVTNGETKTAPSNIYVIAAGISNYTGDQLNLNFAAKDARDFAKAVEIGAVKMFGDKLKVHIRLLTSDGAGANFEVPDAKISTATKSDFERAFADFKNATPSDIFVVYLAGHGISLNLNRGAGRATGDTYLYLTQEATTTDRDVLSVENSRRSMTVSSDELKDLMKQNKALNQVLILDTCAAGTASGSFVAKRDLDADQRRALERLKDNTGFYVLMGSASNAVSYEASQYGQGLLTYALLQGMKGARLRDDQFADVEMLFGYAKDTVSKLAANIGGIQRPETITPDRSRSFDIGQFTDVERRAIRLESPKPVLLRPNLQNARLKFDNLKLAAILRSELRRSAFVNARGGAPIVFVDTDEMPDAVTPSGDYSLEGDRLTISIVLVKNNEPLGSEIKVSGNVNEKDILISRLVSQILSATGERRL
jgi:WD40 repeat protein/uncharacterized caspase-like protein